MVLCSLPITQAKALRLRPFNQPLFTRGLSISSREGVVAVTLISGPFTLSAGLLNDIQIICFMTFEKRRIKFNFLKSVLYRPCSFLLCHIFQQIKIYFAYFFFQNYIPAIQLKTKHRVFAIFYIFCLCIVYFILSFHHIFIFL